jgi:predicted flap endonuclease-1-like 5' DNA nuclease
MVPSGDTSVAGAMPAVEVVVPDAETNAEIDASVAPDTLLLAAPVAESAAPAEPAVDSAAAPAEAAAVPEAEPMAEVVAPAAPAPADDFTRIVGIGPTFNQRLQVAGIRTYAELASKTPEEIAAAIGWSKERVARDQIVEQARKLAG